MKKRMEEGKSPEAASSSPELPSDEGESGKIELGSTRRRRAR